MGGLITSTAGGGWSRKELIELADRRTERRGSKVLNLDSEFLIALQEFCLEWRQRWRRKLAISNLIAGVWQYDLSLQLSTPAPNAYTSQPTLQLVNFTRVSGSVTVTFSAAPPIVAGSTIYLLSSTDPTFNGPLTVTVVNAPTSFTGTQPQAGLQDTGSISGTPTDVAGFSPFPMLIPANMGDYHQFVKHGVRYMQNPAQPRNLSELTPMFERELQIASIYSNMNGGLVAPPQQYFMMPGQRLVLCTSPVPDQNYPLFLDYWAIPTYTSDQAPDQIPLVPPYLHHVLLKKLEASIFRFTIGEGAVKYQTAMGEYKALAAQAQLYDNMAPGEENDYSADDDDDTYSRHNAVQSTT